MAPLNDVLGLAGAGVRITLDSSEYTLKPFTKGMQAEYSAWLKRRARAEAIDTARLMRSQARRLAEEARAINDRLLGDDNFEDRHALDERLRDLASEVRALEHDASNHLAEVDDRAAAGAYDFGGKIAVDSLNSVAGSVQYLWLSLRPAHPTVRIEEVERLHDRHWAALRDALNELAQLEKKASPGVQEAGTSA